MANRVELIHEHTTPSQWHYVETALNTADEGSRGRLPKDFVEKSEWIKCPDFLKEPVESWLKEETYEEHVDADSPEVKDFRVNASAVKENSDILKRLQRFSSWHKVKVAVALCLRYKKKLRGKVLAKKKAPSDRASEERPINGTSISPGLTVVDLEEAEVEILKQVQSDAFPSGIRSLQTIQTKSKNGSRELDKEKKALLRKASSLRSLDPVLESNGIMRVGGRIRRANLSVTLKNPIILPKSSHITSLIIGHVHERTHHGGRGMTLNELRTNGYWIVSGNSQAVYFQMCNLPSPSREPRRTEDGRFAEVAHRTGTTLNLLWGRLLRPLAYPARKSCREEIRSLVYLLSKQSSPPRGGRFFRNRFVFKRAETFHL